MEGEVRHHLQVDIEVGEVEATEIALMIGMTIVTRTDPGATRQAGVRRPEGDEVGAIPAAVAAGHRLDAGTLVHREAGGGGDAVPVIRLTTVEIGVRAAIEVLEGGGENEECRAIR